MRKTALCLGTALLCVAAAGASARDHATFAWSPKELSTLEGIQTTHQRIESMAARFCQKQLRGTRGLSSQVRCGQGVVSDIVARIGDARLTAFSATGKVSAELMASR